MKIIFKKILVFLVYIFAFSGLIESETLQITTYYPAPYGAYLSILTTSNTFLARDGGNVAVGSNIVNMQSPDGVRNGLLNVHDVWLRSINRWASQLNTDFIIVQTSYRDCNTYCCPSGYRILAMGGITNGEKNLNSVIVNNSCVWVREGGACGQSGTIWLTCVR